jgi:hypothetical protein
MGGSLKGLSFNGHIYVLGYTALQSSILCVGGRMCVCKLYLKERKRLTN